MNFSLDRSQDYRPDIDGLRALAILAVIVFHYWPNLMPGGFIGVDVFFVISGYLISSIIYRKLKNHEFKFREFYFRRILRIFPALTIVLFACYGFGWFALYGHEYKLLGKHIAASTGFIQNIALLKEAGYFDVASELKPLLHLWSLSVEEQFYLIFPFVTWVVWHSRVSLFIALPGIIFISLMLSIKGFQVNTVANFYLAHTRIWELASGALLAYGQFVLRPNVFCEKFQSPNLALMTLLQTVQLKLGIKNLFSFLGLLSIVLSAIFYNANTPWPGFKTLFPVGGALLMIAAGAKSYFNQKLLATKPLVWIGLISYPLYLWHWPLLSFLRITEGGAISRTLKIILVIMSFILSALTYHFVEKPIRFGQFVKCKVAILSLLLALVGLTGFYTFERNGFDFRLKGRIVDNLTEFLNDRNVTQGRLEYFCTVRFPFIEDYCRQNINTEPSVMIIGDSHSNALYPGLLRLVGSKISIAALGASSCPPLRDLISFNRDKPEDMDRCPRMINRSLDASKRGTVKTIILASRGPFYISSQGFSEPDSYIGEGKYNWGLQYRAMPSLKNRVLVYEMGLRATFSELILAKKKIIFVLDNPELGFDPISCVGRPFSFTSSHRRTPCAVARKVFEDRNLQYRNIVMKVLKDFRQVILVDAAKPFCDTQWCWAIKNNSFLYRDDDHLTPEGALLVAREILPFLN